MKKNNISEYIGATIIAVILLAVIYLYLALGIPYFYGKGYFSKESNSKMTEEQIDQLLDDVITGQGIDTFRIVYKTEAASYDKISPNIVKHAYNYMCGPYELIPGEDGRLTSRYYIKPTDKKSFIEKREDVTIIHVNEFLR